jgi:hypothetical protein
LVVDHNEFSKSITHNCAITLIVTSVFTITAMDGLGNRKKRGGDPFEIGVMGPAVLHGNLLGDNISLCYFTLLLPRSGLTDNNDGTYECVIEAKQPSMVDYVTSASLSIMVICDLSMMTAPYL